MLFLLAVVMTAGRNMPMVGFIARPLASIGMLVGLKHGNRFELCVAADRTGVGLCALGKLGGLGGYDALAVGVICLVSGLGAAVINTCVPMAVRVVVPL